MALSDTLFSAVLAMDAYHRGYGAGLSGLPEAVGTQIGLAEVIASEGGEAAQAVGFYAIAYTWGARTVIAYRGTDNLNVLNGANDIRNGWVMGAGLASRQAPFAEAFYQQVTGQTSAFENAPTNLILTGHSLGGGLAGYIAALSGGRGIIFDAMPYAAAAMNRVLEANLVAGLETFANLRPFLKTGVSAGFVSLPSAAAIDSVYLDGEILSTARALWKSPLGPVVQGAVVAAMVAPALNSLSDLLLFAARAARLGILGGQALARLQNQETVDEIAVPGFGLSRLVLHEQPVLIMLRFAEEAGHFTWARSADRVYNALLNEDLAGSLALTAETMRAILAYSVIDEGHRPFGDTGVRALFNDADELGIMFSRVNLRAELKDVQQALVDVAVQFAGFMAREAVLLDGRQTGILSFNPLAEVFNLDLSPQRWSGNASPEIAHKAQILLKLSAGTRDLPGLENSDYVVMSSGTRATQLVAPTSAGAEDTVLLIGSTGADELRGGPGSDILLGRGGDDVLTGLGGNDLLRGGDGNDTVDYTLAGVGIAADLTLGIATGAGLDALVAIENLLGSAHADTFTGNAGNNTLAGSAGQDRLSGGGGNDLLLGGMGRDTLWGGTDQDILQGNRGMDTLDGGSGADTLSGGEAGDLFLFSTAPGGGNLDLILDFSGVSGDRIGLGAGVFIGVGTVGNALSIGAFALGIEATSSDIRILFDPGSGALRYDGDGNGELLGFVFASLQNAASLTGTNALGAQHFLIV